MIALGALLSVWVGPTVPVPAPLSLITSLRSVKVIHSDEGRSGFELVLGAGRNATGGLLDYAIFREPAVQPFSRIVIFVTLGGFPTVLMDGIITNLQLNPSNVPGATTVTLTGEDLLVLLDRAETNAEWPQMTADQVVSAILLRYAAYGIVPDVRRPLTVSAAPATENVPNQQSTDLKHILKLAEAAGFVFYLVPGPVPGTSTAYFGPKSSSSPQKALSYNMGSFSNVDKMDFTFDGLGPALMQGLVQDRTTNEVIPIQTVTGTDAPLAAMPATLAFPGSVRTQVFRGSGTTATEAMAQAQGQTDAAARKTVSVSGELDAGRYGSVLQARARVDVRGVGLTYDGSYYVKTVTHTLTRGTYRQAFTLTREGIGPLSPGVVV